MSVYDDHVDDDVHGVDEEIWVGCFWHRGIPKTETREIPRKETNPPELKYNVLPTGEIRLKLKGNRRDGNDIFRRQGKSSANEAIPMKLK